MQKSRKTSKNQSLSARLYPPVDLFRDFTGKSLTQLAMEARAAEQERLRDPQPPEAQA